MRTLAGCVQVEFVTRPVVALSSDHAGNDPAARPDSGGRGGMDDNELLAEAAEAALRATAKLAGPALERVGRAAISGLHAPRSTITMGQRLAQDLAEAEARAKRLREEAAARQQTGG